MVFTVPCTKFFLDKDSESKPLNAYSRTSKGEKKVMAVDAEADLTDKDSESKPLNAYSKTSKGENRVMAMEAEAFWVPTDGPDDIPLQDLPAQNKAQEEASENSLKSGSVVYDLTVSIRLKDQVISKQMVAANQNNSCWREKNRGKMAPMKSETSKIDLDDSLLGCKVKKGIILETENVGANMRLEDKYSVSEHGRKQEVTDHQMNKGKKRKTVVLLIMGFIAAFIAAIGIFVSVFILKYNVTLKHDLPVQQNQTVTDIILTSVETQKMEAARLRDHNTLAEASHLKNHDTVAEAAHLKDHDTVAEAAQVKNHDTVAEATHLKDHDTVAEASHLKNHDTVAEASHLKNHDTVAEASHLKNHDTVAEAAPQDHHP